MALVYFILFYFQLPPLHTVLTLNMRLHSAANVSNWFFGMVLTEMHSTWMIFGLREPFQMDEPIFHLLAWLMVLFGKDGLILNLFRALLPLLLPGRDALTLPIPSSLMSLYVTAELISPLLRLLTRWASGSDTQRFHFVWLRVWSIRKDLQYMFWLWWRSNRRVFAGWFMYWRGGYLTISDQVTFCIYHLRSCRRFHRWCFFGRGFLNRWSLFSLFSHSYLSINNLTWMFAFLFWGWLRYFVTLSGGRWFFYFGGN